VAQLLPSEIARLQILDPIKHHLFPQARRLAEWFRSKGINIHQHTMVLERDGATQAQVWEQAVKMIFRFELTGPVVPYHWRVRPLPAPPSER
jgi:hypothetical protein